MSLEAPPLLAVGLLLRGRSCLVVGAGPVGESKIVRLLECDAIVRVVAPLATPQVQAWHAEGRLTWHERPFAEADLDGVLFVMTATGSEVDDAVLAACERRQLLCNAADRPQACSVYLLAQAQHGPITLATGTSGLAPGLAGRLQREARAGWPTDVQHLVQAYAEARHAFLSGHGGDRQRYDALKWLATQPWDTLRQPRDHLLALLHVKLGELTACA